MPHASRSGYCFYEGGAAIRRDFTDITIVLDRSGSMEAVADDTIGGFNRFLLDVTLGTAPKGPGAILAS